MSLHEAPFSLFFLIECLLFYGLLFLYFLFNKIELIGVEKIEFLRVCKPNCVGQNQVALLVTGVASKKPIIARRLFIGKQAPIVHNALCQENPVPSREKLPSVY